MGEPAMSLPPCQEGHDASLVPELLLKLGGLLGVSLKPLFIYFVHLFIEEAA